MNTLCVSLCLRVPAYLQTDSWQSLLQLINNYGKAYPLKINIYQRLSLP